MDIKLIVEAAIIRRTLNPLQQDVHDYVNTTFGKTNGEGLAGKTNKSTTWRTSVTKEDAPNAIDSASKHFKEKGWSHWKTVDKKFYTDPHREHILVRPDGDGTHEILRIAHWKTDDRKHDMVEFYHSHGIKD